MPREYTLYMGPADGPLVLFVPPLFEESNRMRRTIVRIMRILSRHGIASALPDLPGQNDSLLPTEAVSLGLWRTALAGFETVPPGRPLYSAALRGGCLIDDALPARAAWRHAPVLGATLLRTMRRGAIGDWIGGEVLFGNRLNATMIAELEAAVPVSHERLTICDTPLAAPLWLRAEPGEDDTTVAALSTSLVEWAVQCGAR